MPPRVPDAGSAGERVNAVLGKPEHEQHEKPGSGPGLSGCSADELADKRGDAGKPLHSRNEP